MDDNQKSVTVKNNSSKGLTGYSTRELDIIESDLALKKNRQEIIGRTIVGVLEIAKNLIEIKQINDQAIIQQELMNAQGELIMADLQAFVTKERERRESTTEKRSIVREYIADMHITLRDVNCSDAVKTALIQFYTTALHKVL